VLHRQVIFHPIYNIYLAKLCIISEIFFPGIFRVAVGYLFCACVLSYTSVIGGVMMDIFSLMMF